MEEQVKLLKEQLQQLQADNERLHHGNVVPSVAIELGEAISQGEPIVQPGASSSGVRYVYVLREHKYPSFSGGSGPECLPVEEWIEEVRKYLQVRHVASSEQAHFLYDLLDGEAKMEIKLRAVAGRTDPEKMF